MGRAALPNQNGLVLLPPDLPDGTISAKQPKPRASQALMWMEVFSSRPVTGLGWVCFQAEASWRDSGACIFGKCSQTTPLIKELNLCQVLSTFR